MRRQAPDERELCSLSDSHLLHNFTDLVCKEHSLQAKALACEIMRRYTASRVEQPFQTNGNSSIPGSEMWGDAHRVFQIFGIKRGPLDRIRKAELIESSSLEVDRSGDEKSAVRAKRLYDLNSIEHYLKSQNSKGRCNAASIPSSRSEKPNLKVMQK
jgi:hypothetical protein